MLSDKALPSWITKEEEYIPCKDNHVYIDKTLLKLFSLLNYFREEGKERTERAAGIKTAILFLVLCIVAGSRNMAIPIILLVLILVRISLFSAKTICSIGKRLAFEVLFSCILLLPAYLMGQHISVLRILLKISISLLYVNSFAATVKWNAFTKGLSKVFIPDLFLFTFDLTLKYIVVLGEECIKMMEALKIRSIGKNRHKSKEQAHVLAMTFIKSKRMSEEMYEAMICRGYTGEYRKKRRKTKVGGM